MNTRKKGWKRLGLVFLVVLLVCSVGFNAYLAFFGGQSLLWTTYLQSPEEIEIMELGVLHAHADFRPGEALKFQYDFTHEEYPALLARYAVYGQICSGGRSALLSAFPGDTHPAV